MELEMSKSKGYQQSPRRYRAYVSSLGTTQLHLRNPWVIAFWSVMFPGLGHLLLSKYLRGYLLVIWEVFINVNANINIAILYSFTGRFDMARNVLNTDWTLLYISTFLFAIWDSYRTTVDLNHQYILAAREDAPFASFKMDAIEINYLDKKSPWSSVIWSFMMPGAGQLSIHRILAAFFIMIWWIVIMYYSKVMPAIQYTFVGNFAQAKSVINAQWLLNIPSIYFFALYDAYINTVESNKLFDWEQAKFLKRDYQNSTFRMPFKKSRGDYMYIISTFEHSIFLESAISAIQMKGIDKEDILAVPMDTRGEERKLFDSIHQSDGLSLLDLPFILGSLFMLFGGIYGFILTWGPILWGLIGLALGLGLGFAIKLFIVKKFSSGRMNKNKASEVVLINQCKEPQMEIVKDLLWANHALGVRKLELNANE
jgi:hypothetical protein